MFVWNNTVWTCLKSDWINQCKLMVQRYKLWQIYSYHWMWFNTSAKHTYKYMGTQICSLCTRLLSSTWNSFVYKSPQTIQPYSDFYLPPSNPWVTIQLLHKFCTHHHIPEFFSPWSSRGRTRGTRAGTGYNYYAGILKHLKSQQ